MWLSRILRKATEPRLQLRLLLLFAASLVLIPATGCTPALSETPSASTTPAFTNPWTPTRASTLTPTNTLSPEPAPIVFDPVEISSDKLFQGGDSCDPKTLTLKVRVTPAAMVSSIGLFYRIVAKQGDQSYPWGGGLAMIPGSSGQYVLTITGNDLPSIGQWQTEAWLDFQFVANDANSQPVAWSPVFRQVTFWQCYI
jgi:hypothetical protein